jgi:hypothetical protein
MPHQPGRSAGRLVAGLIACLALAGLLALTREWRGPETSSVAAWTTGRYVSQVTDVQPPSPGLRVRVAPDGASMTVQNDTGRVVVVRSYSGEDYLRITADGVQENVRSLSSLLNRAADADAGTPPAPTALAAARTAPPLWRQVSTGSAATWADQRIRWGELEPPPAVQQQPDRSQLILDWSVQLEVGGRSVRVRGVLSWIASTGGPVPADVAVRRSPATTGDDGWR